MIRLRAALRDRLVTGTVIGMVAAFIGADLVASSGWDWRGWLAELRERLSPPAVDASEIRNYVEFVIVRHDGLKITTGIQFASSFNRSVAEQWCYAEPLAADKGMPVYTVPLARRAGTSAIIANDFVDANLRPLGITAAEAQSLLENHCRFRN